MVGVKRGSKAWVQMLVGRFTNAAKKIHKDSPQCDDDLKEMIEQFGKAFDALSDPKSEPIRPLADVIIDRVFGEE